MSEKMFFSLWLVSLLLLLCAYASSTLPPSGSTYLSHERRTSGDVAAAVLNGLLCAKMYQPTNLNSSIALLPPAVQTTQGGTKWRMYACASNNNNNNNSSSNCNNCSEVAQDYTASIALSISFWDIGQPYSSRNGGLSEENSRQFTQPEQELARQLLSDAEEHTGVRFIELAQGSTLTPNLHFRRSDCAFVGAAMWVIDSDSEGSIVICVPTQSMDEFRALLMHEIGHGWLGARHPDSPESTTSLFTLPVDGFELSHASTFMATPVPTKGCSSTSSWAPLDVASMQFRYGLHPRLIGDTIHTLGGDAGSRGVGVLSIGDTSGLNTLRLVGSAARVTANLNDGAYDASYAADGTLLRWAPGTGRYMVTADIRETGGGTIIGNDAANLMIGSMGDDTFDPRSGDDVIWPMGSVTIDSIILYPEDTGELHVAGFDYAGLRICIHGDSFPDPELIPGSIANETFSVLVALASGKKITVAGIELGRQLLLTRQLHAFCFQFATACGMSVRCMNQCWALSYVDDHHMQRTWHRALVGVGSGTVLAFIAGYFVYYVYKRRQMVVTTHQPSSFV